MPRLTASTPMSRLLASAKGGASARVQQLLRPAPSFRDTAHPSPPTYSLSAANAATTIANSRTFDAVVSAAASPYFTWWGGTPVIAGNSYPNDGLILAPSSAVPFATNTAIMEFMHHGRYLDLIFLGGGATNQIYVDGMPITEFTSDQSPTLTTASDGNFYRIILDFGSSALRRIGWRTANKIAGVTVGPFDTVYAPSKAGVPRAVILGDSFTEGTGATDTGTGWASLLGSRMGWDTFVSGSGGTGYLATNVPLGRVKLRDRLATDCTALNPDIVVVAMGINDGANTAAAVAAEAALCYDDILAGNPDRLLIVISPFSQNGNPTAFHLAVSPLLEAACEARGGIYINLLSPKLVTGTGKVGATVNDGNASVITGSDGTHPTQLGHEIYAAATHGQLYTLGGV